MRRVLSLVLALASMGVFGALTGSSNSAVALGKTKPQIQIQIGRRRHWNPYYRNRVYMGNYGYRTETRVVERRWGTFRETYQLRYLPDGSVQRILISRERIY
jgi:hypothetical protein